MIYLRAISFFFIGITLLLTVFQFIRRDEWWIRFADFIHLQLTVLSLFSWLFLMLFSNLHGLNLIFIIVGVPLTILHLFIILPYTFLYGKQVKKSRKRDAEMNISILEANVLMYNVAYDLLLNLISEKTPDLVIAIETDKKWEKALDTLTEGYPYQIKYPRDNTYGLHLYSKLPLQDEKIDFLVEDDIPSIQTKVKLRSGNLISVVVLHPKPPSPTENYLSLERDAELIIMGRKIADMDLPVIVTGDLNDVAWSHTSRLFKRISGLLDPRIGRGFFNTFHAKYPLMRWPLDHIFHSKHFLIGKIQRLRSIKSDHFPIYIDLYLENEIAKKINDTPESVSSDDYDEIDGKLDQLED